MKNGFIVILLLAVGFLFYQNSTLKSQVSQNQNLLQTTQEQISKIQTKVEKQSQQMAVRPQEGENSNDSGSSATPTASPNGGRAAEQERLSTLIQDRKQIQEQMKELTPQNINRQIQQRQAELNALQNQLKAYQNNQQSFERNIDGVLQFQKTLNQQTQTLLADRIRNQERAIRSTRRDIRMAELNGTFYQDERVAYLQNQLAQQQNDLQILIAQKDAVSNQGVQQTSELGNRVTNSKAVMAYTQNAIQNQMGMIRQDIESLNQQKVDMQTTINMYQQELQQLNQAIREQNKTVQETP